MSVSKLDNLYPAFIESQDNLDNKDIGAMVMTCANIPLNKHISALKLQSRLDRIQGLPLTESQIEYLKLIGFNDAFIDLMSNWPIMPSVSTSDEVSVRIEGTYSEAILWQAPVNMIVREMYFANIMAVNEIDVNVLMLEATRRFQSKGDMLRNCGLRFIEGGSDYRYRFDWYSLLFGMIMGDFSDVFLGTTNVGMAMSHGMTPYRSDYPSISSPTTKQLEFALEKDQNVLVRDASAFQMAHLYSHFGDSISLEWGSDLVADMGLLGSNLDIKWMNI